MNNQTLRELERVLSCHPSLVSYDEMKQVEEWRKRKVRARILRQLETCQKSLSGFADSTQNVKVRLLLSDAVGSLRDSVFIIKELELGRR